MAVDVVGLVDEGLGNSTYLVDLGQGRALVVDPSRDVRAVRGLVQRLGLRVAFVADTHLHADFLSGARQFAADAGAVILASAAGGREFGHTGLRDGQDVDLGGLRLQALATPGHTAEHVSFLLLDGDRPVGVFTGGSLMVGTAARTDLVSAEQTEPLARAQYHSLQRLLTLPEGTAVWPTHGGGSFCAAPAGGDRVSTIGREKATNPLLAVDGPDAFVVALLGSLGNYPAYFDRLGELNRTGPAVLPGPPALPPLTVPQIAALLAEGAEVVDIRTVEQFAAAHLPGSLSIPLRPVFATWLGSLVRPDRPVVVVRDSGQDPGEIAWQAAKIGYELAGELAGGVQAWADHRQDLASTRLVGPDGVAGAGRVLDIRQAEEFRSGHLPGALHIELGALARDPGAEDTRSKGAAGELRDVGVVMCGHGERAMGAASLLERRGLRDVAVLQGGPQDWAQATGQNLQEHS